MVLTTCPDPKCKNVVAPSVFASVLTEEEYMRYEKFITKSFIESNKLL